MRIQAVCEPDPIRRVVLALLLAESFFRAYFDKFTDYESYIVAHRFRWFPGAAANLSLSHSLRQRTL